MLRQVPETAATSNRPDPDSDLIPRLQAGDQAAFALLVDRHIGALTGLAVNMLGDPFMAEDVVQSAFLKCWTMLPGWVAGEARLLGWLRTVATRECLDILRRKSPIFTDAPPEMMDESESAESRLSRHDQAEQLRRALERLPAEQRAAITLSYYQNLPHKQAAQILGKSLSAYESLLRRARTQLKGKMEIEGDQHDET